jgi:hypothetical protein
MRIRAINNITETIISVAIAVYRELGPGFQESGLHKNKLPVPEFLKTVSAC